MKKLQHVLFGIFVSVMSSVNAFATDHGTYLSVLTSTGDEVVITAIPKSGENFTVMRNQMEYEISGKFLKLTESDRDRIIDLLTNDKLYNKYMLTGKRVAMKSVNKSTASIDASDTRLCNLEKKSN